MKLIYVSMVGAAIVVLGTYLFASLAIADLLLCCSRPGLGQEAAYFLQVPIYLFTRQMFGLKAFDMGGWGFAGYLVMVFGWMLMRANVGWRRFIDESIFMFAPIVLLFFESGILLFDEKEFWLYATSFLSGTGLGWVTNGLVMAIAGTVLIVRLSILISLRFRNRTDSKLLS